MKLEIVQAGDPVLRKKSRALTKEEILSPSTQELITLMRDTMREAPGVGLGCASDRPINTTRSNRG